MTVAQRICGTCGTPSTSDARFCGRCGGAVLEVPPVEPQKAKAVKPAQKTMLGISMSALEGAGGAPPGPALSARSDTIVDPLPNFPAAQAGVGPKHANRTMLGVPAVDPAMIAGGSAAPHPAAPQPVVMPAASAPASAEPAPPNAGKRSGLGPSNRTMLGVSAPVLAQAHAAAAAARQQQQAAAMQPVPRAPETTLGGVDVSIAGLPSPRKRARAPMIALLSVGLLMMLGVVVALAYWRFGDREIPVRASIVQVEHGQELLEIEIPGAPAGSRVRFAGTEQSLDGARARFPLSRESLVVGDNALSIDVIAPSGAVETHRVTLTLELRVRANLETLAAPEPAITIVVEALPGSTAMIEGQPVTLDERGQGTRAFPLSEMATTPEGVQHVVRWIVQPPSGVAAEGTLTTRVPMTSLQIDRPGTELTTDRAEVEIAGAVVPNTIVTIDAQPVPVHEGRFLHRYSLPSLGDHTLRIVARAPDRAPITKTVTIHRVADMAREAANFTFDRALTYARVAQSPSHYQGQRVAFEGRVYNVDVQGGRSVLQMLVRDCPTGQRCPLWVTYPAATDVSIESWVRVLGTIVGEQQFRSESGQIRTVPRVDATYVLPTRP